MPKFDFSHEVESTLSALRHLYKRASRRVRQLSQLPEKIRREIREDIDAVRQRDPAAKSDMEVCFCPRVFTRFWRIAWPTSCICPGIIFPLA